MTDHFTTRLIPPFSIGEALKELASFSNPEFEHLLSETRGPQGFDTNFERSKILAEQLSREVDIVGFLLTIFDFLYSETRRRAQDETTLRKIVTELLSSVLSSEERAQAEQRSKLSERLFQLLSYNQNVEHSTKLRRLKEGFLKNATGFSSFVDLRPNIDDPRTSIVEYLPLIQFRISTDTDSDDIDYVFQLDQRALDKLEEAVKDMRKKLALLQADSSLSSRIVK